MKISAASIPPKLTSPSGLSPNPWLNLGQAEISFEKNFGAPRAVRLGAGGPSLSGHGSLNDALLAARQLSAGHHGAVAVMQWKNPFPGPDDAPAFILRRVEVPDLQDWADDSSLVPMTTFHPEQNWPGANGLSRKTLSIHAPVPTLFGGLSAIVDGTWEWRPASGINQPPKTSSASALPA